MARVVSPDRVLSAPVSLPSDFYREEFIRHRECLKRQREYFSERAITDADHALGSRAWTSRTAVRERRCGPVDGPALREVQRRDRPFGLVGSHTASLTDSLQTFRADLHTILRAGVSQRRSTSSRPRCVYPAACCNRLSDWTDVRRVRRQGRVADGAGTRGCAICWSAAD